MKRSFALILLLTISPVVFSQQPVKINLLEYFDKVPLPPVSAKEAYDKCGCNAPNREGDCKADALFKVLLGELEQIQKDISLPTNSPQADLIKKMQDPEYQKKMQSMSDEEKMKMAMEMRAAYSPQTGTLKPEPKNVIDVEKEMSKLNEANAGDLQNINANAQAEARHRQELEAKHKAVDDWEALETKNLPIIHTGGEGGDEPDPKAVFALKVNACKKHIAIVDEELKQTGKTWADAKAKRIALYTPYQRGMEKIHYGDDAKNVTTRQVLSSGQKLMVGSITNLIQGSEEAFNSALDWYDRYVQLQKNKPQ